MKYFLSLCLLVLAVQQTVAPPVTQNKKDDKENEINDNEEADGWVMEYKRYLQEVVETLERDEGFKEKLVKADEHDLRTGKIADHLELVDHNIRTRLDELKREELERLRHLARKEYNLENGLDLEHLKIAEHLDHTNERTFEIQDLKNLIAKTTKDLAEADRRRREEFKRYEMQKKYEEQEKLKAMNEGERQTYEEELKVMREKHKNHEPVHHPGSKQQLEEVWEEQDHMEGEDFNPRTFFFLHDVDGNGVWDQDEVKALFLKELDKLYAKGATKEELVKRSEEMERMREHVFNEADLNKDGFISYEEFLEQTKKPDFQQDEGWEGLDEQQIYTHEEFEAYERRKHEEMQKMIAKGMFPPQYVNMPAQGVVPPVAMHQQQYQDQHHGQYVPQGQVPVQQQGYPNQQQYHPQMPQQPMQGHQPNLQYHPGQVPVQHQGQQPQYQQIHPQQYQQAQQQQQPQQVPQQPQPPQNPQVHQSQQQQPPQHPPVVQQPSQQQNIVNPVPQGAVPNAVPHQANQNHAQQPPVQQNAQPAQPAAAQSGVHANNIHTAGKV